jgi:hypothetical protein
MQQAGGEKSVPATSTACTADRRGVNKLTAQQAIVYVLFGRMMMMRRVYDVEFKVSRQCSWMCTVIFGGIILKKAKGVVVETNNEIMTNCGNICNVDLCSVVHDE